MALRAQVEKWTFAWTINYIGEVDNQFPDEFNDIFNSTGEALADTCLGPPDDVLCHDISKADDYFNHAFSVAYTNDNWVVRAGMRNVFDQAPPQVDSSEVTSVNNSPIGRGYDLYGRTLFLNVIWRQ